MKVLWIINSPIGPIARKLKMQSASGTWLTAALKEVECNEIELYIVCCIQGSDNITIQSNNITYIAIGGNAPTEYIVNSDSIKSWETLYHRIEPDLIHIWGTEYPHSLAALKGKPESIPALIYVQGVMKSVSDNYYGGLDKTTLIKYTSIIERITKKSIFDSKKRIENSEKNETEEINLANGIIYETTWSKNYYKSINKSMSCYYHRLPIEGIFRGYSWNVDGYIPHRIFTPASDYPLKGVHFLIQAVAILKNSYPDITLIIPGARVTKDLSLSEKLKQKAYRKYLRHLITKNDLWDNIEFPGILTPVQMAENMRDANIFVCSSTIENHSSTLREAMLVGTPCITTNVGGIPEYFIDNEDGLMYSPYDVDALVNRITKMFTERSIAESFSDSAKKHIIEYYDSPSPKLMEIYNKFLSSFTT